MIIDKRLEELLDLVVAQGGSDLHIYAGGSPMIRVAGQLFVLSKYPSLTGEDTETMFKSIVPEDRWSFFKTNEALDLSYAHKGDVRFRINGFRAQGTVSFALRLVPHAIRSFSDLNLPSVLEVFSQRKQGFFLVVGPVGHGKSTTLAAMINRINDSRAEHILTIEDPVEYVFTQNKSLIHQREVHIDVPDFHTALQSAFREDVDVIMVGEMRDYETISNAVTAAETGHLSSPRFIRTAPHRLSIVLLICSQPSNRRKCACNSLAHWRVSFLNGSSREFQAGLFQPANCSSITMRSRRSFVIRVRTRLIR